MIYKDTIDTLEDAINELDIAIPRPELTAIGWRHTEPFKNDVLASFLKAARISRKPASIYARVAIIADREIPDVSLSKFSIGINSHPTIPSLGSSLKLDNELRVLSVHVDIRTAVKKI